MLHMDPRFVNHSFGYPTQHSQYYSHPSFWTPPHLPYGPTSLTSGPSHQSAFSVPVKRETSDGEESNRSSDSELGDEDEQYSNNQTTFLPQTKAIDCVLPGITRDTYHNGQITPPDSAASASPNTTLDSAIGSPGDGMSPAMFPPIYTPVSSYQPANFSKPVPINNFPLNLHKLSADVPSDTSEPTTTPLTQTACQATQLMFRPTQTITIEQVSPIPSSDSQTSPPSVTPTPSPPSSSPATDSEVKKTRTCYTARQLQALERVFLENPYPDGDVIERLSGDLDVAERKLRIWFQNKRARTRRRMQQYGSGAGAPTTLMMPATMPTPHMPQLPATPVSTHMPYVFPMPTTQSFPGGLYHPHALQFPSGQHAFPFSLSQGPLPFPPGQHGTTLSFQNTPTIKNENATISTDSQSPPHHINQSPISFYHGLVSPTVTQNKDNE